MISGLVSLTAATNPVAGAEYVLAVVMIAQQPDRGAMSLFQQTQSLLVSQMPFACTPQATRLPYQQASAHIVGHGDANLGQHFHPADCCVPMSSDVGKEIVRYLFRASVLSIRTQEFGHSPGEALLLPVIHWGFIKELKHSVLDPGDKPDKPAAEWDLEDDNEDK